MVDPLETVLMAGFLIRFGLVMKIRSPLPDADAIDTTQFPVDITGCG